jgi:hypothetical protein
VKNSLKVEPDIVTWATRLVTRHIRLGTRVRSAPPPQQGPTIHPARHRRISDTRLLQHKSPLPTMPA